MGRWGTKVQVAFCGHPGQGSGGGRRGPPAGLGAGLVLRNGLNMSGVSAFIQQIIIGFVVILAVFIDQLRSNRR